MQQVGREGDVQQHGVGYAAVLRRAHNESMRCGTNALGFPPKMRGALERILVRER